MGLNTFVLPYKDRRGKTVAQRLTVMSCIKQVLNPVVGSLPSFYMFFPNMHGFTLRLNGYSKLPFLSDVFEGTSPPTEWLPNIGLNFTHRESQYRRWR